MATQDRLPTGDGVNDNWSSSDAGANEFTMVDDPIGSPDDDTTYAFQQDSGGNQLFTFTAFSITSTSITKLTVTFRGRRTAAGALNTRGRIRVSGSNFTGAPQAQTTSYVDYTEDWLTNPDTAAAWLEADIEGTGSNPLQQFGMRGEAIGAGEEARVTQVYATVDFTVAGGVNPIAIFRIGSTIGKGLDLS